MSISISNFKEKGRLPLWLLLGVYLGLLIYNPQPYVWFITLSLPLAFFLLKNHEFSFYIIMVSLFFSDWFRELGLIPDQMTWFPDVILFLLTAKVVILMITKKGEGLVKTSIGVPILLFLSWGLISTFVNSGHIITTILGFRTDLKFVLMFFLLVNLNPEEQFFRNMLRLFIILLILQVPVALAKLPFYGQGEEAIGTYAVHGGTFSTILPLVAISIFSGFYLFEKSQLRYIFLCLLFVLFSIVGGKRAFVFFGILLFLFLSWQAGRKHLIKLASVAPFLMIGFLACIYFVPSLRPAFKNPSHLIDFPLSYTTGYTRDTKEADGRFSAMAVTYNTLKKDPKSFLLGFAPGSMSQSFFKKYEGKYANSVPIFYGRTQFVLMSLEYGFVGVFLFLWLFLPLFRANKKFFNDINENYWKAISFGFKGIWFTYLMGVFYGTVFREDILAFTFWFFAATIYCLGKQKKIL